MNYDGVQRVALFKASNYDAGFLRLDGTYDGVEKTVFYGPENISMSVGSKGQTLTITPEYISMIENSLTPKRRTKPWQLRKKTI